MPQYIIHKDGAFNIFSTVVDAPIFDRAISRESLESWYREEYGARGMDDLPRRLERAIEKGISARTGETLDDCIGMWAHVHKKKKADFIGEFLTLTGAS